MSQIQFAGIEWAGVVVRLGDGAVHAFEMDGRHSRIRCLAEVKYDDDAWGILDSPRLLAPAHAVDVRVISDRHTGMGSHLLYWRAAPPWTNLAAEAAAQTEEHR